MMVTVATAVAEENPKREFRGAWMSTIYQPQYAKQSTEQNKRYLSRQLDELLEAGCNAVIFQVRPQADALYASPYEPWSRHLTGRAGRAPSPMWDPLEFMVEECHKRGMELHAWLNPYRVTTTAKETLPKSHIYHRHPERFVRYNGRLYFDPALPENREFIATIVKDIITRYDVDAIHMDDYFYPYPVAGQEFPDDESYSRYGKGMKRADWRRHNVDLLIEQIHNVIVKERPWVRFGISPFGIWRNKKSDPRGSDTNGLQNYDDLYADVLKWTEEGWVDYMMPQLYWPLEHKRASSRVLAAWWNDHANGRHMYFGQDVKATMDHPEGKAPNQLNAKIDLSRRLPNVQGNCWWPAYELTGNYKDVADRLEDDRQSTIALVPAYTWLNNKLPEEVRDLVVIGHKVTWERAPINNPMRQQHRFVVYAFPENARMDITNPEFILAVTPDTTYELPSWLHGRYTIVVTALDRVNNESAYGSFVNCKL